MSTICQNQTRQDSCSLQGLNVTSCLGFDKWGPTLHRPLLSHSSPLTSTSVQLFPWNEQKNCLDRPRIFRPLDLLIIAFHFASKRKLLSLHMCRQWCGVLALNTLICLPIQKMALPSMRSFPTTPCAVAADVCLSCIGAKKTKIVLTWSWGAKAEIL